MYNTRAVSYTHLSMDKVEKMGLPRVSSGVLGISEVFNPKKTHPDFDFPWSWFVKGQEIPPMPEKVYVCLKKARGVTFDFLPYNDFFIKMCIRDRCMWFAHSFCFSDDPIRTVQKKIQIQIT